MHTFSYLPNSFWVPIMHQALCWAHRTHEEKADSDLVSMEITIYGGKQTRQPNSRI